MLVTRVQKLLTTSAAALIGLALGSSSAFATGLPITDTGILQIGNVSSVLVGVGTIPFCINWGGGSTCVAGTTHQMAVSGSSNLFSTAPSASDKITDMLGVVPIVAWEQVVGAGAVSGSIVNFDLTSMPNTNGGAGFGVCNNNLNNSCSPPNSPFTFSTDGLGQVTIAFSTLMNAYTCPGGVVGTSGGCNSTNTGFTGYRGSFTTQFSGTLVGTGACNGLAVNIINILSCEGNVANPGTIQATWSATESPIPQSPEPISFVLFGSGLVGVALLGRRIRKA